MDQVAENAVKTLNVAFDDYPQTRALKSGAVKSDRVTLNFSDIKPANRFFKPMVRELKFDISEMAIATAIQAKAYGRPIVLMPATIMGRFQHGTMLYNAARGTITPADLAGKRVGVRSYSQTTVTWVRGILQNDYGVDLGRIHWISQEDGHVAEYREPAGIERNEKNLLQMLRDGDIDAAIYGAELPDEPTFRSVIPEPAAAAQAWYAKHNAVPINHMVVATERLSESEPDAIREVFRLLAQSKQKAGLPKPGGIDFLPFGLDRCRATLDIMINYMVQQNLVPRRLTVDDLFDATTRTLKP